MPDFFGFLNIDKPIGMTSHDVVSKIRRKLKIKKVGHTGTLDPLATGVLIICLGSATRLSDYIMKSSKKYRATIQLGVVTDTYDAEGEILSNHDVSHITYHHVEQVLNDFVGDIEQVPPMYSAIKQGGRKLYELARESKTVELEPRPVTIDSLDIVEWQGSSFVLDVVCSPGTYIRSLAYDIGERLEVGAHLAGLIRTRNGNFHLSTALQLDALLEFDDWHQHIISVNEALSNMPSVGLNDTQIEDISHGRRVTISDYDQDVSLIRAHSDQGEFVALLKRINTVDWQPHKVFLK